MIPDGWRIKPLHEVAKIQTGIAKGKKDLKDPVELPYLRVANVQDGRLDLDKIKVISVSRREISRYSLRKDDVLLTEGGDFDKLGRGTIWSGQIEPCLHQNHVFAVRTDPEILDPYFFSLQAGGDHGRAYFLSCAKRSTNLASINSSQLKEFPTILPPIKEQKKISKVIHCWDKSISTAESLIIAKQQRKQALMQKLLTGKKRLPGFKTPWAQTKIRSFLTESRNPGSDGSSARKLTVKLYGNGVVPRSERMAGSDNTKYYRRKAGQFIYGKLDFLNGAFGIVPPSLDGYESTLDLPAFDFSPGINPEFFLSFVGQTSFYAQFSGAAEGGRKARRIQVDEFLDASILVPTVKEQVAIADVLGTASKELILLAGKKSALERQKKALMTVLLTGKKRLKT